MEFILSDSYEQMSEAAAGILAEELNGNPSAVFALPTGSTPVGTYQALAKLNREGKVDFSLGNFFNVDEYVGLSRESEQGYYHFLYEMVMFPAVFSINQYVHNLIIMVIDAVYAGLISLTSYSISLFVQKSRFLAVALPGLTVLLWSFLAAFLQRNRWSPIEYLSPVIAVAEPKHIVLAILFGGLFLISICLLCIKCKRCVDEL